MCVWVYGYVFVCICVFVQHIQIQIHTIHLVTSNNVLCYVLAGKCTLSLLPRPPQVPHLHVV